MQHFQNKMSKIPNLEFSNYDSKMKSPSRAIKTIVIADTIQQ